MTVSCGLCGGKISGIKSKGSKSKHTVSRMFGAAMCHRCVKSIVCDASRIKEKKKSIEEIPVHYRKYVQMLV